MLFVDCFIFLLFNMVAFLLAIFLNSNSESESQGACCAFMGMVSTIESRYWQFGYWQLPIPKHARYIWFGVRADTRIHHGMSMFVCLQFSTPINCRFLIYFSTIFNWMSTIVIVSNYLTWALFLDHYFLVNEHYNN